MPKRRSQVRGTRKDTRASVRAQKNEEGELDSLANVTSICARAGMDTHMAEVLRAIPNLTTFFDIRRRIQFGLNGLFRLNYKLSDKDMDLQNSLLDFMDYFTQGLKIAFLYTCHAYATTKKQFKSSEKKMWFETKLKIMTTTLKCSKKSSDKSFQELRNTIRRLQNEQPNLEPIPNYDPLSPILEVNFAVRPMTKINFLLFNFYIDDAELMARAYAAVEKQLKMAGVHKPLTHLNVETFAKLSKMSAELIGFEKVYESIAKSQQNASKSADGKNYKDLTYEELLISKCKDNATNDFAALVLADLSVSGYIFIDPFKCLSVIEWAVVMKADKESYPRAYVTIDLYLHCCRRSRKFTEKEAAPSLLESMRDKQKFYIEKARTYIGEVHDLLYPTRIIEQMIQSELRDSE